MNCFKKITLFFICGFFAINMFSQQINVIQDSNSPYHMFMRWNYKLYDITPTNYITNSLNGKVDKTTYQADSIAAAKRLLTWTAYKADTANNARNGVMSSADHTKLGQLWNNNPVIDQTFTNDSIDCSRAGGIYYNSYSVASNITLKGKILTRITGGFVVLKLIGNGTNTVTLGTNMLYADGQPVFINTNLKVNLITIVWFNNIGKWIVYNSPLTY